MHVDVSIRSAVEADLPAISRLLVAQLREHDNALSDSVLGAAAAGLLRRAQRGQFLLAFADGEPIGFAALSYLWTLERGGRAAWLDELYVVPARRGGGVGARLLEAALRAAGAAGSVAVDLEIETGHERSAALYQRHGFELLGRQRWTRPLSVGPPIATRISLPLTGGCLCGGVRYRIDALPLEVSHCHCSMCRRASGAPLVTWATIISTAFVLIQGAPRQLHASAQAVRTFCADCGTPLTFRTHAVPDRLDATVASLDRPELLAPTAHVWATSQLAWLRLDDDLPRHQRGGAATQE